ncbi:uncharacterized protein EV154DRAFT_511027 [Mucor mucedo]|uniref:uncharacterized protein n=1 Tax=Mucor mucedo TaxID=29922 RepID=UPI0022207310|nr:uncharacterized protein EV154DRAFT_511027 [Mucor mucedo]KAI7890622.1 hypothetical protein EV154DRAFT_511027 [Mucor mucedo]
MALFSLIFLFILQQKELLKDSARLAVFLQECLSLGSLRGFRHFETFVRGREELVLFVSSKDHKSVFSTLMPLPILESHYTGNQVSKWKLPELISPMDKDLRLEKDRTVFLIAGYAKYRCPYVWLRSHHEQLIQPDHLEDDNPLQLSKTTEWKNNSIYYLPIDFFFRFIYYLFIILDVSLWEILSEILSMTIRPDNPFELDFGYIDALPLEEAVLLTGGLIVFLENIWVQADPNITFVDKGKARKEKNRVHLIKIEPLIKFNCPLVYDDIKVLQSKHLDNMYRYSIKVKTDGSH